MLSAIGSKELCGLTNSFKHARSTLSVPSFYVTAKLLACLKYAVVVFLVVYRTGQAVAGHAFR